jgi:hypothetical protein
MAHSQQRFNGCQRGATGRAIAVARVQVVARAPLLPRTVSTQRHAALAGGESRGRAAARSSPLPKDHVLTHRLGVALAAIQGRHPIAQEQDARLDTAARPRIFQGVAPKLPALYFQTLQHMEIHRRYSTGRLLVPRTINGGDRVSLISACLSLIQCSLANLRAHLPSTEHSWGQSVFVRSDDGSGTWRRALDTPLYHTIYGVLTRAGLPGIQQFSEVLMTDPRYLELIARNNELRDEENSVRGGGFSQIDAPDRIALRLIFWYLKNAGSIDHNSDLAQTVANDFVSALADEQVEWSFFTVIRGLYGSIELHTLPGGLLLTRLSDSDTQHILDDYDHLGLIGSSLLGNDDILGNDYIAEKRIKVPQGGIIPSYPSADADFDNVTTALRLLKQGQVDRQGIYAFTPLVVSPFANSHYQSRANTRYAVSHTYELLPVDLPNLNKLLRFVQHSGNKRSPLRVAIDRLNYASERDRLEDRLIDLCIAMESLYGDRDGANSYKISMRAARYLKRYISNRRSLQRTVADAYVWRNKLVHGEASRFVPADPRATILTLEEVIRGTLSRYAACILAGQKPPDTSMHDDLLLT